MAKAKVVISTWKTIREVQVKTYEKQLEHVNKLTRSDHINKKDQNVRVFLIQCLSGSGIAMRSIYVALIR